MSYDFYMEELKIGCEHDNLFVFTDPPWYTFKVVEVIGGLNYTYNVAPMFTLALGDGGVRRLVGMSGKEAEPLLELAFFHMYNLDNRDAYIRLNPPNGWGDLSGARRTIKKLYRWAQAYPNAVFRIY